MTQLPSSFERGPPGLLGRWRISLRHPFALACLLVGGSSLIAYLAFSPTWLLLIGGAIGVFLGGIVGLALSLSAASWAARYQADRPTFEIDVQTEAMTKLRRALSKLQYEPGTEHGAERAVNQLNQIRERFRHFETTLASKMKPTEITYERYHGVARAVRDSVLQNLQTVLLILQSLHGMGDANLEERERHLSISIGRPRTAEERAELDAVRARIAVRTTEQSRLIAVLTANELAITRLDEATLAIAGIQTGGEADLEATLNELQELAARANKYSTPHS
jgi:hypothetical protein